VKYREKKHANPYLFENASYEAKHTKLKGNKLNPQQSAEKRKYNTNSLRGFNFHQVPLNVKFWMKGDQHALQNLWIKERKEGEGEIQLLTGIEKAEQ